jgi:hypothetical protein
MTGDDYFDVKKQSAQLTDANEAKDRTGHA